MKPKKLEIIHILIQEEQWEVYLKCQYLEYPY